MAFGALGSNKTRAALTLLAIVVGVFAVISASTAVKVIDNFFQNTMTLMGSDVISVTTRPMVVVGNQHGRTAREPITFRQFERYRDMAELSRAVSPNVNFRTTRIHYGDQSTEPNVQVRGSNEFWISNNAYSIEEGRDLTRDDVADGRPFVLIGSDVRDNLFRNRNAIGQRIRIDGQFYTV
ncbi:MAG: ABC transporter permease, partial [Balneolaceae bacterium]